MEHLSRVSFWPYLQIITLSMKGLPETNTLAYLILFASYEEKKFYEEVRVKNLLMILMNLKKIHIYIYMCMCVCVCVCVCARARARVCVCLKGAMRLNTKQKTSPPLNFMLESKRKIFAGKDRCCCPSK